MNQNAGPAEDATIMGAGMAAPKAEASEAHLVSRLRTVRTGCGELSDPEYLRDLDSLTVTGAAYDAYDRSVERLVSTAEPVNERIRQAFEAGYDAGRAAERSPLERGADA